MDKPISHQAGENASNAQGIKMGIRRLGSSIQISLHCDGDYQGHRTLRPSGWNLHKKGEVTIDLRAR